MLLVQPVVLVRRGLGEPMVQPQRTGRRVAAKADVGDVVHRVDPHQHQHVGARGGGVIGASHDHARRKGAGIEARCCSSARNSPLSS